MKKDNYYTALQFEEALSKKDYDNNLWGVRETLDYILNILKLNTNEINYTGREYNSSNGDFIIDNKVIEIKYLTTDLTSSGTYLNTSIAKLEKYGCLKFSDFQEKHGVFNLLEEKFSDVRNRLSPITNYKEVEPFISNNLEFYKRLKILDRETRRDYTEYLYNYFLTNKDKLLAFTSDILSKNISNKQAPDYIVVCNANIQEIYHFDKINILSREFSNMQITSRKLGIKFGGFKINMGWQNGNGLCNPTIRVFLK